MSTTVDSSTTVVVERNPGEPDCEVCSVGELARSCSPTEQMLSNVANLTLEFSCPTPQNVFSVTIAKHIGERLVPVSAPGRCISTLFSICGLFCWAQNQTILE